jgi:hypothetical protein
MNRGLLRAIRERMAGQPDEELLRLWVENDRAQYSEETFETVRSLLTERGVALPSQSAGTSPSGPTLLEVKSPAAPRTVRPGTLAPDAMRMLLRVGLVLAAFRAATGLGHAVLIVHLLRRDRGETISLPEFLSMPLFRSGFLNLLLGAWFFVSAWGAFRHKAWSRDGLKWFSWGALLGVGIQTSGTVYYSLEDLPGISMMFGFLSELMHDAVYPIVLLYLIKRPESDRWWSPGAGAKSTPDASDVGPGDHP